MTLLVTSVLGVVFVSVDGSYRWEHRRALYAVARSRDGWDTAVFKLGPGYSDE